MTLMGGASNNAEGCTISMGPWGSQRYGQPWSYKPNGYLTQITIRHGAVIDSVLFQSVNRETAAVEYSNKFGGPGGHKTDKVTIDTPEEQLKSMDFTVESYRDQRVITSIIFHTNVASYGPIGRNNGKISSIPMEGGVIVGFHGRAGKYLNAIGMYVVPKPLFLAQISGRNQEEENFMLDQRCTSNMKSALARDIGPWGSIGGGKRWDDGVFSRVLRVCVHLSNRDKKDLVGIQFEYETAEGEVVKSPVHGSPDSPHSLDFHKSSDEELVGIEGFTNEENGSDVVRSITLYTNKGKYGPYGVRNGKHFMSSLVGGKIVGFWGASGTCLNAIGLHMSYF